jgi:hypothetical protein
VVIGGSAAYLAAGPLMSTTNRTASQQSQTSGTTALGTTPSTATATPGTPHRTSPTATPPHSSTPVPNVGQQADIHGTVTQVNTSTSQFTVLATFGTTATVAVNPQTLFEGASTSLSGLQIGWSVEVQGFYQADGSLLASDVNSAVHA